MKHILIIVCMLFAATSAFAQNKAAKAQNRFADGPNLVAKDIEYISAKSTTIFKVWYNLYVHPPLAQAMRMPTLSDTYVQAKKRLITQGRNICDKNDSTDLCTVHFWTDLASIPTLKEATEEKLAQAQGIFIKERGSNPTFQWLNPPSAHAPVPTKEGNTELENYSGGNTQ